MIYRANIFNGRQDRIYSGAHSNLSRKLAYHNRLAISQDALFQKELHKLCFGDLDFIYLRPELSITQARHR